MGQCEISNYVFLQDVIINWEFYQFIRELEDKTYFRCNTESTSLNAITAKCVYTGKQINKKKHNLAQRKKQLSSEGVLQPE